MPESPLSDSPSPSLIVIGASAGGVHAILDLMEQLPGDLDAAILIVLHIDSNASRMPVLTARRAAMEATHGADGERIEAGHIYFAPPNHHLMLDGWTLRLSQHAKENHVRPAIDPLFRSAALTWQGPLIGVILTGMLDDGAAGLRVLKQCGGIAVVQDPDDCYSPSMPRAAIAATDVDYRVPIAAMGSLLTMLVRNSMSPRPGKPSQTALGELELSRGHGNAMEILGRIGHLSGFTCPECGGSLWQLHDSGPRRFRCHTGHALTLRSLEHAHAESATEAMWVTLRTLSEKQELLREIAETYDDSNEAARRAACELSASVQRAATALRELIEALPGSIATVVPDEPVGPLSSGGIADE